jgi:hypothetical protein
VAERSVAILKGKKKMKKKTTLGWVVNGGIRHAELQRR